MTGEIGSKPYLVYISDFTRRQERQRGVPRKIRTFDRSLRRRLLYPAELSGHVWCSQ